MTPTESANVNWIIGFLTLEIFAEYQFLIRIFYSQYFVENKKSGQQSPGFRVMGLLKVLLFDESSGRVDAAFVCSADEIHAQRKTCNVYVNFCFNSCVY